MKIITKNKKAFHNFHIEDKFEAGIALQGSEVKSLREGKANLVDAYARFDKGELWLMKAHISPYAPAFDNNHEPTRKRKLLLHRHELEKLTHKLESAGYTLIPLALYFKNGKCKVELGLGKGKKSHDKRSDMKKRDTNREIARAMKR